MPLCKYALRYRRAIARCCHGCLLLLTPALAISHASCAMAQDAQSQTGSTFQLGEIDIQATRLAAPSDGSTLITQQEILDQGAQTIGQALSKVSGVAQSYTGQRAEAQVYIRGFDAQQITLNIDGIPIYVPYDGNVDLGRLLTQGISGIEVTKGLGSLLYGPNNMGGSINIVTSAPSKPLEGSLTGGVTASSSKTYGEAIGMQMGSLVSSRWYIQGGVATNNSDGFPLSGAYTPVAAQPGGDRLQARSRDTNGNLKIGFTPNATDEYALGVYTVSSSKQSPPYTGNTAVTGQKVAYWNWPQWDKQSYYFIGNTALGDGYAKTRLYRDNFTNQLDAYDNASYDTTTKPYSFLSEYDDYSTGASLELGQPTGHDNLLKIAAFYKDDFHNEIQFPTQHNPYVSPWLHFKANTEALGFEDSYSLSQRTKITFGYRHDRHQFDQAQQYTDTHNTLVGNMALAPAVGANNEQFVVTHNSDGTLWRFGMGLKTRFPGIKDVYSYRLGQGIPNPALGPEQALNREVGASGRLSGGMDYDVALYWDSIRNAIEFVTVSPGLGQNQNVGTATNRGMDVTLHLPLAPRWRATLQYSYLDSTLGTPGLVATNTPRSSGDVAVSWHQSDATEIAGDVQASTGRQSSTNGLQPVAGYALANLRLIQHLDRQLTLYASLDNVLDQNYALTEGFPMPGRTLDLHMAYRF